MRTLFPRFILAVALMGATLSCGTGPNSTVSGQKQREDDEAAVRDVIAANMAASNKHDAVGVAATYAPDADLMAFAGGLISGSDAIIQHEKTFFAGAPDVDVSTKVETVRFLTPDVAIAENSTIHRFPRETSERATLVLVRNGARWLIAAVRVLPGQERADMFSSDLLKNVAPDPGSQSSKKK